MTTRNPVAAALCAQLLPIAVANADSKFGANFVASGAGNLTVAGIEKISNTDVAPAITKLLGTEMLDVDGHAPDSILLR